MRSVSLPIQRPWAVATRAKAPTPRSRPGFQDRGRPLTGSRAAMPSRATAPGPARFRDVQAGRQWDAPGMPELPEAERAREALERHALGRVVADADDSDSYVCRPWPPGGIREALVGHRVTGVGRVGKQLLVETDGPVLGLHLGMSGSLRFDDPEQRFKRFALVF